MADATRDQLDNFALLGNNDQIRDHVDSLALGFERVVETTYRMVYLQPDPAPFVPPRLTAAQQRAGLRRIILDIIDHKPGISKFRLRDILRSLRIRFRQADFAEMVDLLTAQGHLHVERRGQTALLYRSRGEK